MLPALYYGSSTRNITMIKYIGLLLFTFSSFAHGEIYVCLAEAVAGVKYDGKKTFSAQTYSAASTKFIHTNDSGRWVAKKTGDNPFTFDRCSPNVCGASGGYAGTFTRNPSSGIFKATWLAYGDDGEQWVYSSAGYCTEL